MCLGLFHVHCDKLSLNEIHPQTNEAKEEACLGRLKAFALKKHVFPVGRVDMYTELMVVCPSPKPWSER